MAADQLGFSRSAINACPNQVDFIVVRGAGEKAFDVKRLPKGPRAKVWKENERGAKGTSDAHLRRLRFRVRAVYTVRGSG